VSRLVVLVFALLALTPAAPVSSAGAQQPPQIDARAWLLLDADDGAELAASAPDLELPIASATKLMTAYVALEELELDQLVSALAYQGLPAEVELGLRAGEQISVGNLLAAMLIASANDAAVALAVETSGSIEAFVARMNREARRLGLEDTQFSNPIGLDAPDNHSSARDLASLTLKLRRNKRFREIVSSREARLETGSAPRDIVTRNDLLAERPWVDGVKTGRTIGAGYVLVGSGSREGVNLVSVVLGAPSEAARDAESLELLKYGFSLYELRTAVARGRVLAEPELKFSDESLSLVAAEAVELTLRADQVLDSEIVAPEEVEGPIERREPLGEAIVTVDGKPAGTAALVAARAVAAPSTLDKLGIWLPALLIAAGALLIVVAFAGARRRRSQSQSPEEQATTA
jgi:D-alanyl-D-alanine carboxypeptidase (penicillin-binding protein 5/6)